MKLPYTEMKFHPDVKSQICFSSLRVSRKRADKYMFLEKAQYNVLQNFEKIRTLKKEKVNNSC